MSMIVWVIGLRLFHEHDSASTCSETFMSMIVRKFVLRIFHEYDDASIWSETLS